MSDRQFDVVGTGVTEHLTSSKLKSIQVRCHVGLGDAFVMQGLILTLVLSGRYGKITINTRRAYLPDLQELYASISGMIDFQTHETYDKSPDAIKADEHIDLGYFSGDKSFNPKAWDREFYRQAGIPFINRWKHCYIPNKLEPMKRRDFTIRHHDPKRKFLIEGMKPDIDIVEGGKERLLDWVPELMAAREIHVIDSCVMNLVESMWHLNMIRPDASLCYHEYARKELPPIVLAPWKVIR